MAQLGKTTISWLDRALNWAIFILALSALLAEIVLLLTVRRR